MADIEARLQRLEDKAAIAELIASYGPLADRGMADELARLWVDNGEYTVAGFGTARGHAEIAALIEGETHQQLMAQGCAHVLSPHTIALGGGEAEASGYSVVFRRSGDAFEACVFPPTAGNWSGPKRGGVCYCAKTPRLMAVRLPAHCWR